MSVKLLEIIGWNPAPLLYAALMAWFLTRRRRFGRPATLAAIAFALLLAAWLVQVFCTWLVLNATSRPAMATDPLGLAYIVTRMVSELAQASGLLLLLTAITVDRFGPRHRSTAP